MALACFSHTSGVLYKLGITYMPLRQSVSFFYLIRQRMSQPRIRSAFGGYFGHVIFWKGQPKNRASCLWITIHKLSSTATVFILTVSSDYLAELSALPHSGIAQIESSVPLPGSYITHGDPSQTEHASLYFLACISMRRLLNRVHQLLYARNSGAATDISRFPAIVTELDHQLDEWREVLPQAFRFNAHDVDEHPSECGGFLRQRYLTCKSVIYRPYLAWLLVDGSPDVRGITKEEIVERATVCIDACTSHILALTGFSHTILVDTWICALS
jgi:hypothetical protein